MLSNRNKNSCQMNKKHQMLYKNETLAFSSCWQCSSTSMNIHFIDIHCQSPTKVISEPCPDFFDGEIIFRSGGVSELVKTNYPLGQNFLLCII